MKWNNFWSMVESVTISFTKALATVIISVLVIKAIMLIPYGLVVLGGGVGIMYFTPKEYVPKCLSEPKEVVDGVIGSCKEIIKDPLGAVEAMGQGLMDTIQTTEGVASVAGTMTGMYLSPKLDKLFSKGAGGSNFKGMLKGQEIELPNVGMKSITYVKRNPIECMQLRNKFNSSIRSNFVKEFAKQNNNTLKKLGFTEIDIAKLKNGQLPQGYQVHHKLPLDDGGTNDFSNLIIIKNAPYHKVITNYQNKITKGLEVGELIQIHWPIPKGNFYNGK